MAPPSYIPRKATLPVSKKNVPSKICNIKEKLSKGSYKPEHFLLPLGRATRAPAQLKTNSATDNQAAQPIESTRQEKETEFTLVKRRRSTSGTGTDTCKTMPDLQVPAPVPTNNSFQILSDETETMEVQTTTPPRPIDRKPPPIFIYGIQNTYQFIKTLSRALKDPPRVQHNRERIKFQLLNNDDFSKVKTFCVQQQIEFATGIDKTQRPIKVVIRKLPIDTDIQDLSAELTDLGYKPLNITQMTRRGEDGEGKILMPLFLVALEKTPQTKEIYAIDHLLYYRVHVEPFKPPSVLQCYRCQRMGHTQDTCQALPRCLKCGQGHFTKACEKTDRTMPATCANCQGSHPANYRGCKTFKSYSEAVKNIGSNAARNARTVPSVAPKLNKVDTNSAGSLAIHDQQNATAANETLPSTVHTSTSNGSAADLKSLIDLIKGINFSKILPHIRRGITRLQQATDMATKATALIETLVEMADDGCF